MLLQCNFVLKIAANKNGFYIVIVSQTVWLLPPTACMHVPCVCSLVCVWEWSQDASVLAAVSPCGRRRIPSNPVGIPSTIAASTRHFHDRENHAFAMRSRRNVCTVRAQLLNAIYSTAIAHTISNERVLSCSCSGRQGNRMAVRDRPMRIQ